MKEIYIEKYEKNKGDLFFSFFGVDMVTYYV